MSSLLLADALWPTITGNKNISHLSSLHLKVWSWVPFIHQRRVWNRLRSIRVRRIAHVPWEQVGKLVVIPIGHANDELLVVLERWAWIMNDNGSTEAIAILAAGMAMPPVGAGLAELEVG
jgi:hypothetical protein